MSLLTGNSKIIMIAKDSGSVFPLWFLADFFVPAVISSGQQYLVQSVEKSKFSL